MSSRGLRHLLQPGLYAAIAVFLHGVLFLIPLGGANRPDSQTVRGVRVRAYVETPPVSPGTSPAPAFPRAAPQVLPTPPPATDKRYSALGGAQQAPGNGLTASTGGSPGPPGGSPGSPGGSQGTGAGNTGGEPPLSEYGQYLARLRSEGVQGWARDSARKMRQGWKGTGGWGTGTGAGSGPGSGEGGRGGAGSGQGGGGGYLDPRVRMVVNSYPPTGIVKRYTAIPYPELQIKKHQFTSGWWNVYIEILTDQNGKIVKYDVLRPETDGPRERMFLEQVRREIARWTFDPTPAEIHVDVRFYVE